MLRAGTRAAEALPLYTDRNTQTHHLTKVTQRGLTNGKNKQTGAMLQVPQFLASSGNFS